jgi:hypothetical protein
VCWQERVYAIGGYWKGSAIDVIEVLDIKGNEWQMLNFRVPKGLHSIKAIGVPEGIMMIGRLET